MARMCDGSGGNIGSITAMCKSDGFKAKTKEWAYAVLDNSCFDVDDKGDLSIHPGQQPGTKSSQCLIVSRDMYNTAKAAAAGSSNPDAMLNTILLGLKDGGYEYQAKQFTVAVQVVKDIASLDFSESIDYIQSLPAVRIGQKYLSDLMPEIELTQDPKVSDKYTFGQMHLISGPGKLTPSLEIDLTTTELKVSGSNKT